MSRCFFPRRLDVWINKTEREVWVLFKRTTCSRCLLEVRIHMRSHAINWMGKKYETKLLHHLFSTLSCVCFGHNFYSQCHNKVITKQIDSSSGLAVWFFLHWLDRFRSPSINVWACKWSWEMRAIAMFAHTYWIEVELFWAHQLP